MGKKVRVFLGEKDVARLTNQKRAKDYNQECFFCDLLDSRYVQENGHNLRVGLVRLFGRELSIYFSQQEGCWLPYQA